MASTYVNNLRLNEMATGDESGNWGVVTNLNLELAGEALGYGTEAITTNADTHTSTVADGASDPVRAMYVKYTGTLDSACTITIAPNTMKRVQFIENGTSGSQNIIISQGSGANITIPPGDTKVVYLDGAGSGAAVVDAFASLSVVDLKVQDDLTIADDLTFSSDSAVVTFGADGDTTLTHTDGTGLTLNSTNKLCFNDASQFVQGSSATVLSLGATDEIDLTATAIDINGTLDVSGQATFADGSAGAPSISNTGDVNAGLFFSAADVMSFSAGGTAQFTMADGSISPVTDNDIDLGTASLKYKSFFAGLVDSENFKINGGQGTDGQLLTSTGSGVAWEDAPAGGPTFKTFGTSSIMVGDATTGTIDAANYNTGLGVDVFAALTSGDYNTTVGWASLDALTTGINNTAVGAAALTDHSTGDSNTAVGYQALANNTTADSNVAVGVNALLTNTTGQYNVAVGTQALQANVDDSYQVAVGFQALLSEATSGSNVAIGGLAMMTSNGAANNVAVGKQSGYLHTTGDKNAWVGSNAGFNSTTSSNNAGLGYTSLYSCTTGSELVGIGPQTLYNATTAVSCIAIGDRAFFTLVDSPYNVAIGYKSGFAFETGVSNEGSCTFVGDSTGRSVTSGKQNTFIGATAGYATTATTTGYRNTMVGVGAHGAAADGNLENVIGFGCKGVGNGYNTLGSDSNRTYNQQGSATWSGTSDERLKTDVVDEPIGLAFINDLRPVKFKWKKKKDVDSTLFPAIYEEGSDERVQPSEHGVDKHGFIAQELEATIANYSDMGDAGHEIFKQTSDGMYNAAPTALIPMLVKALQEADDKIDALVARVTTLEG